MGTSLHTRQYCLLLPDGYELVCAKCGWKIRYKASTEDVEILNYGDEHAEHEYRGVVFPSLAQVADEERRIEPFARFLEAKGL